MGSEKRHDGTYIAAVLPDSTSANQSGKEDVNVQGRMWPGGVVDLIVLLSSKLLGTFYFLFGSSTIVLHLHDLLALLPMTILRTIPVNLLTVPTAVAIRLASLTELASIGVQGNAADFAGLPKGAQGGLDIGKTFSKNINASACSQVRKCGPKLCLRESI